jgi:hypothetical protein
MMSAELVIARAIKSAQTCKNRVSCYFMLESYEMPTAPANEQW